MSNTISREDLISVYKSTPILYTDSQDDFSVPFIQANVFQIIISLLYGLKEKPMTIQDIANYIGYNKRQASYYYVAGIYLRLFVKVEEQITLSDAGRRIANYPETKRNLALVKLILQHQLFNELFGYMLTHGAYSSFDERELKRIIVNRMLELKVCEPPSAIRRSYSVLSWLRWIFELAK